MARGDGATPCGRAWSGVAERPRVGAPPPALGLERRGARPRRVLRVVALEPEPPQRRPLGAGRPALARREPDLAQPDDRGLAPTCGPGGAQHGRRGYSWPQRRQRSQVPDGASMAAAT